MVLVLAVICIIMYVIYISKDISHIEKELRIIRHDLDTQAVKMKQLARHAKPAFVTAQVVVPPAAFGDEDINIMDDVSIGSKVLPIDVDITDDVAHADAPEDVLGDTLSNENEVDEAPKEDIKSLSWAELKERCKQRNIPIKGCTKEQLIAKLADE